MSAPILKNHHILVVEDDYLLAVETAKALGERGAAVVGPVPTVEAALRLVEAAAVLTGAVLDVNLQDETAFPVADALHARGVPFVFATGYDSSAIPDTYRDVTVCEKPVSAVAIAEALSGSGGGPRP